MTRSSGTGTLQKESLGQTENICRIIQITSKDSSETQAFAQLSQRGDWQLEAT